MTDRLNLTAAAVSRCSDGTSTHRVGCPAEPCCQSRFTFDPPVMSLSSDYVRVDGPAKMSV